MIKLKKNITIINKILKKNIIQPVSSIRRQIYGYVLKDPYFPKIKLYDTS